MNCENFKEKMYALIEGELSPDEEAELDAHMRNCPDCARELEARRKMLAALRELGSEAVPPDLAQNVMRSISAGKAKKKHPLLFRFAASAATAAVLVVGAINVMPRLKTEQAEIPISDAPTDSEAAADIAADESGIDIEESTGEASEEAIDEVQEAEEAVEENIKESGGTFAATDTAHDSEVTEASDEVCEAEETDEITAGIADAEDSPVLTSTATIADDEEVAEVAEAADEADEAADESEIMAFDLDEGIGEGEVALGSSGGGRLTSSSRGGSEPRYVQKTVIFKVDAEYADAVEGLSLDDGASDVAAELDALEVEYEIEVVETDLTDEYETASDEQRSEIERMCEKENCEIEISAG